MEINEYNQALYYEKKAARRTGNFIGLGLLLFFTLAQVSSIVVGFLAPFIPNFQEILKDSVFKYVYSAIITVTGFLLGGIVIIKSQKRKVYEIIPFNLPKMPILPLIFMGLGACMVGNVMNSLFASVLDGTFLEPKMNDIDLATHPFGIAVNLITSAILPAFTEEFLFRGAILGSLKKFGNGVALFVSTVLFAFIHGNLVQIPFAFIAGLALGLITIESRSILPAIIIHFLNNFISVINQYIEHFFGKTASSFAFYMFLLVFMALGIVFTVIYLYKNEKSAEFAKTKHILSSNELVGKVLSSGTLIVFYVFTVINIILAQITG